MANFTEALSKPVSDIEKPKAKPAGTYLSMISGPPEVRKQMAQGEEREILSFKAKPLMAREDVDQSLLEEHDAVNTWPPQRIEFWDGEQGEYQAKMFVQNVLGIDPGPPNKSKTLGQMCAEAPGKQLLTTYENYPYQDKAGEMQVGTRIKSGGLAKV